MQNVSTSVLTIQSQADAKHEEAYVWLYSTACSVQFA